MHILPDSFFERAIKVHVVGCGGTGSQLLPGLVALHRTLLALDHPGGLEVTVWDADTVAAHNAIRQNFFLADVGRNKADVMVNRLNIAHADAGVQWIAQPDRFSTERLGYQSCDVLIGCVDTRASRRAIAECVASGRVRYWIDCGNDALSGQMIVGEGPMSALRHRTQSRLPLVTEFFPEIASGEDDDTPSCSAADSIRRQGVVTNRMAANWALAWLDQGLRFGQVDWCGVVFNLVAGKVVSIAADPAVWADMGVAAPPAAQAA